MLLSYENVGPKADLNSIVFSFFMLPVLFSVSSRCVLFAWCQGDFVGSEAGLSVLDIPGTDCSRSHLPQPNSAMESTSVKLCEFLISLGF